MAYETPMTDFQQRVNERRKEALARRVAESRKQELAARLEQLGIQGRVDMKALVAAGGVKNGVSLFSTEDLNAQQRRTVQGKVKEENFKALLSSALEQASEDCDCDLVCAWVEAENCCFSVATPRR